MKEARAVKTGKAGFTLIEIIITTAVLAIVMGSVISTGSVGRTQFGLSINQEKTRSLISRAKGLAINSLLQAGGGATVCGYGVHIESRRAVIFADRDPGSGCEESDHTYSGPAEELSGSTDRITLSEGLYFAYMPDKTVNPPAFGGDGTIDVLFTPPHPTTYIDGIKDSINPASIGVAYSSKDWRKVIVTRSGLITTESY